MGEIESWLVEYPVFNTDMGSYPHTSYIMKVRFGLSVGLAFCCRFAARVHFHVRRNKKENL